MAHVDWPDYSENKRILAGIVQVAGGEFVNKTHLFKAYYWAHLHYWKHFSGTLTPHHRIVRMPKGPGIDGHKDLLAEMKQERLLDIRVRQWPPDGSQMIFTSGPPVELTSEEREAIEAGISHVFGKSSEDVSGESHQPSWEERSDGEPMDIYQDVYSADEVRHRRTLIDEAQRELDELLG